MIRICLSVLSFFLLLNTYSQEFYLLTGTYTSGKSQGIYVHRFNTHTGEFKPVSIMTGVSNPSFLSIAPSGRFVYAVNENGGKEPGEISAFVFDKKTGMLRFLNKQRSGGDHPCYITTHSTGNWVIVGNYTGGSLAAFPVNADGSLQPYSQLIQHAGTSANPQRQEHAHVHATVFSPDYSHLLVPDLGIDRIMNYNVDVSAGKNPLQPADQPYVSVTPGYGPRHIDFHPGGKYVYLMEELSGTVSGYKYKNGKLKFIQRMSSHPPGYVQDKGSADIHVSPDGKFLYASNRGDANNLSIFSIDKKGRLKTLGFQPTLGVKPRNFLIDPTGRYLLVANQDSNHIIIFARDLATGLLTPTGKQIEIPNPVCLKMTGIE